MAATETALGARRWTLGEYVVRYEYSDGLQEILAEGEVDRDVIADALVRWSADDMNVLHADYVSVTQDEIAAAGFAYGTRGHF